MPPLWLLLGFVLVLFLILGDSYSRNTKYVLPEKAASIQYNLWPKWDEIESQGTRIRILWILHDYVPFVNAGSEICAHTVNKHLMRQPYKYDIFVASPGFPKCVYDGLRCFDIHDTHTLFSVLQSTNMIHSHSYL